MAMPSAEYWARRFEAMESDTHKAAQMTAAEIAEVYKQAEAACKKEVEAWYGRLAKNNGVDIATAKEMLSRQELKEFKWDVKQYIKAMEDNETSGAWVKELENASARYHISKYEGLMTRLRQQVEFAAAKEEGILTESLKEAYSESYYRTCYEIQSGLKTGFEISAVNEKQINAAIKRPWAADDKAFSDRIWKRKDELVKKLDTEITQNIMLGRGVQASSAAIAKDFNTTVNRAATLVYTETAHAASMAQKAGFEELGVKEFGIVATLDNVTSEICQEMDGKHLPMSEFKAGVTAPPFHPNCRSVTAPYFEDSEEIFGVTERAARDPETGKTVYVDDMTYPEWKKVYVDKTQTLDEWKAAKAAAAVEVPKTIAFQPAESIEAAEEYAKKFISDGYSPTFKNQAIYKGISLEHANEINKTLEELYAEYDLPPISGIKVISPTSAQGKKIFKDGADAVAAYNPTEKGLFINKDVLKNAKALEEYNKKARDAYDYVIENIDSLKGSQKELAEVYQKAGRSLVGDGSVKDYITHEMGHHVQWDVLSSDANNAMGKSMAKYAPQISGYANASKGEYIAESFVAYTKGERDLLDPQFVQYLDKNVAKSVAKSAESGIIKNIRIEHFKPIYDKGTVSKECIDEIVNALGNDKKYFDEVKLVSIERNKDGTIDLLRTNVTPKGNWANVCLEINEIFFKDKTLEEVNEIIYNNYLNGHSVIQNLSDAVLHESGHAKLMQGRYYEVAESITEELQEYHIEGISDIAEMNGDECIAECYVLKNKGIELPKQAQKLYDMYMRE